MIQLKVRRLWRGWSQAELARRAHMNPNTISQIESERLIPYPKQLAKLARALGVPAARAHLLLRREGGGESPHAARPAHEMDAEASAAEDSPLPNPTWETHGE